MTPHRSPAHEAVDYEKLLVHNWRVARLTGVGIPGPLAEVNADHLDCHQVARLVQLACPRGWPCALPLMSGPVNWRDAVCRHADPDLCRDRPGRVVPALARIRPPVPRPDADRAARGGHRQPVPAQAARHGRLADLADAVQRGRGPASGGEGHRGGRRR